jgi:hypothetical protein
MLAAQLTRDAGARFKFCVLSFDPFGVRVDPEFIEGSSLARN